MNQKQGKWYLKTHKKPHSNKAFQGKEKKTPWKITYLHIKNENLHFLGWGLLSGPLNSRYFLAAMQGADHPHSGRANSETSGPVPHSSQWTVEGAEPQQHLYKLERNAYSNRQKCAVLQWYRDRRQFCKDILNCSLKCGPAVRCWNTETKTRHDKELSSSLE